MVSLAVFARRIRQRGQQIETNTNAAIVLMAGSILTSVVLRTPVDTGRARAGWQVELGFPPFRLDTGVDQSGQSTISRGEATLRQRKSEETIYISNNVEYIGFLNDGSSAQAPANFVQMEIMNGIRALNQQSIIPNG